MADSAESTSQTASRPWWAIDKEGWRRKFKYVEKLNDLRKGRDAPLPPWTAADVELFAQQDPVNGPRVLLSRQASNISAGGAAVGGLSTALYAYRSSRSLGGAFLTLIVGTATSWAVAEEAANVGLGLYSFSPLDANLEFIKWWQSRHEA